MSDNIIAAYKFGVFGLLLQKYPEKQNPIFLAFLCGHFYLFFSFFFKKKNLFYIIIITSLKKKKLYCYFDLRVEF